MLAECRNKCQTPAEEWGHGSQRTLSLGSPASAAATDPWDALGALTEAIVGADRLIAQMQASREMLLALAAGLAPSLMDDDGVPAGFDPATWDSRAAELAERSVAAEIGTATRTSDRTIQRQMAEAADLVKRFPETLRAFSEGRISLAHTRVVRDAAADLDDDSVRADYEARVVAHAENTAPQRLRRFAVRVAEKVRPEALALRFERARAERRVWVSPLPDGMAELTAVLPAAVAQGIHGRLTDMARELKDRAPLGTSPGEVRTLDQLRADLLADLLLTGGPQRVADPEGHLAAIRARVEVTIPVELLRSLEESDGSQRDPERQWDTALWLGLGSGSPVRSDGPVRSCGSVASHGGAGRHAVTAELNGQFVLDPETARRLAGGEPAWNRVLTDPLSGAVLAVDRYRPNADLRRYLVARDTRCRFPGCGIRAAFLDLDHTEDAAHGGMTSSTNLAGLCRRHHVLKHHSRWTVRQVGRGVLEWTSPTGRVHRDDAPALTTRRADPQMTGQDPPPF
ncbi:HNH endonuclease signature motif containing protein [Arthrobacter woluwensis]|uniref:HNH endonuclease signature motif containing protein n=1 Tax=Arthrobacter woluwensis TaxID=156980 RepID=UPI0011A00EF7|nr:HNH endonuclease signature motif containing protein [Arthrobacter woluwensis]